MKPFRILLLSIIHIVIFMGSGTVGQSTSLLKDKNGTLHVFSENVDLPFAINNIGVLEAMSALAKCLQSSCPPHHYRSGCEELMSKGNCTPCAPCPDHQYRSGCILFSKGICLNVTTCNPGEFEVQPPTKTNDRQCHALLTTTMTATRSTASTTLSTTATTPCSTTINFVLDCANPSSRAAITSNNICEVAHIDNCCCDEISSLTHVGEDVNVRNNETMLYFGTIREVGGSINGGGSSQSNRGSLQVVDFGQVTRVGGNVQLRLNHITRVEFGALARVDGNLFLYNNALATIDFGTIAHIDLSLALSHNALTNIDFGAITRIGGSLSISYNNALTSIDFGGITRIGGGLYLHNNALTRIDFATITHINGDLYLNSNTLTSIDFGAITHIDGRVYLHNNVLTSIDFVDIIHIGIDLRVHNNPSLTSINCHSLGTCLCRSTNTNPINCPSRCTWSSCA
eukprot:gene5192-biopygen7001